MNVSCLQCQILLDKDNRAYGVAYTRHGIPQIAHASKEIILSAGAFQSPMLLMKSGIGPAEVLNEAGVSVDQQKLFSKFHIVWFITIDTGEGGN